MRRAALVWLAAFAVYAATIGLDAFRDSEYAGDEPHYLLTADSIVEDGDPDLLDDYRSREYDDFYPYALDPHGGLTEGRLNEPHAIGLPLLIAPAYAVGGAVGAELLIAALAALAVALAYRLALHVVPDPWALGATVAVALSPPMLAYGSAVYPEIAAGAALAGAALLALRLDEAVSRPAAFGCFGLLGTLPWLGPKYVLPGLVVGVFAYRSLRRHRRRVLAIGGVEVALFSTALLVGVNEGLYGGPTPYAADIEGESATGADFPLGYVERAYRVVALFVDRDYGLLRWAPVLALALAGAWLLLRERRGGLARAIPELRAEETAGALCAAACGAQLAVAAFLAPTMFGFWFPGRHLVAALPLAIPLVALALRHAPRVGALLAAAGVAASVWIYLDARLGDGGLVVGLPDAPWGPLEAVFPLFDEGATWPFVLAAVLAGAAAAALAFADSRDWRQTADAARRRYSP